MNYIRTKDEICTLSEAYWAGIEDEIINQADTIEELCDELVYNHQILSKEDKNNKEYLSQLYCFNDIYGAIWTNKGLIYVAKMNSEGVLELI